MPIGQRPAPPVGTCRLAISGKINGHTWVNVMWLQLTLSGAATVNDLKVVVDAIATSYATNMLHQAPNTVTVEQITASWLHATGQSLDYVGAYSLAGSDTGTVADDAAAAVINWTIGDYYRGGHPRTYVPGVETNKMTGGSDLTSSARSTYAQYANTFRNAVNALTSGNITAVKLGTVRFVSNKQWLSPPVFREYTSAGCRSVIGLIRGRLIG